MGVWVCRQREVYIEIIDRLERIEIRSNGRKMKITRKMGTLAENELLLCTLRTFFERTMCHTNSRSEIMRCIYKFSINVIFFRSLGKSHKSDEVIDQWKIIKISIRTKFKKKTYQHCRRNP